MFKWWQERQEQKERELRESLKRELREEMEKEEEESRPQFQRVISEEAEKHRDSIEPWVTVVGESMTADGIKLELDWNDAFVKFLKAQGITGKDDTQCVQMWLAMIAQQTSERLSAQRFEELDGKSEYE